MGIRGYARLLVLVWISHWTVSVSNDPLQDWDEVRIGVVKRFTSFLRCISPSARKPYIAALVDLREADDSWRFRSTIADQVSRDGPTGGCSLGWSTGVVSAVMVTHGGVSSVWHFQRVFLIPPPIPVAVPTRWTLSRRGYHELYGADRDDTLQ